MNNQDVIYKGVHKIFGQNSYQFFQILQRLCEKPAG